jgi:hypothetical protein
MKQSDLPLARPIGARLPPEALRFIAEVARLFPGSERDLILIREKPISPSPREGEKGNSIQRESKDNVRAQTAT